MEEYNSNFMTFLKFRSIEDNTKKEVKIPIDNVRLSPLYIKLLTKGITENEIMIKRWYELYNLFSIKGRFNDYTSYWYIGRGQPFLTELIDKQKKYIQSLSEEDNDTLSSYTFIGDTIINNFMRNNYDRLSTQLYRLMLAIKNSESYKLPLDWQIYHFFEYINSNIKSEYKKSDLLADGTLKRDIIHKIFLDNDEWFLNPRNIEPLITDLILKTVNIILNAPRSSYPIKIYRGIVSEHIDSLNFISSDFWSTSIAPNGGLLFTGKTIINGNPVQYSIYEITVQANVPCLYISDISSFTQEFEILLPPFIEYRTSNKIIIKNVYESHVYDNALNNINNTSYIPNKVATVTVIADRFNEKGLKYLERKRHWRNVKKQEDIDEYLEKIARKEKYKLRGISVNDEYLPTNTKKGTIKNTPIRKSAKRNSFKRFAREAERRKTHKLKRSTRRVYNTNTTN